MLHLLLGSGWVAATVWHLATRPRRPRGPGNRSTPPHVWRRAHAAVAGVVLLLAALTLVSGVARVLRVPAENAWHGGLAWMLLTVVAGHVVLVTVLLPARRRVDHARDDIDDTG